MDFTLKSYDELLASLMANGFKFQPFNEFLESPLRRCIILRHDVDALPQNSLRFAILQNKLGIRGSYYFRKGKNGFDLDIIKKVAALGHEIGYHYETMDNCRGDLNKAWNEFRNNLENLRQAVPVKTICMHGSPLSKYDNKQLWEKFDYHNLGIIGEPYFDIDFSTVAYLTDTGRRWNGKSVSVRDKVKCNFDLSFNTTKDIIQNISYLPTQVMITMHPQRWHDRFGPWIVELVTQKVKNIVKYMIVKSTKK